MDAKTTSHQIHNLGASPPSAFNSTGMHGHRRMMMHMTFYWGHIAEVLFSGWPGRSSSMYALALVFVFVLAVLVEWLSHCSFIKPGGTGIAYGVLRTAMYTMRHGLSYLVMLAVMSFNGGVFLAAIGGHAVGFLLFANWAARKSGGLTFEKRTDLPPMTC